MNSDVSVVDTATGSASSTANSVIGVAKTMPSSSKIGGQSTRVLSKLALVGTRGQQQSIADGSHSAMTLLRMEMRASTVIGESSLEEEVGGRIVQNFSLLRSAGELLAQKISNATGISSHSIDVILDIGSGKYPGLGASLAYALLGDANVSLKSDVKVMCITWDDELPLMFKDARVLKILIVTAARTPMISKQIQDFIARVQDGTSNSSDVAVKICSLVCLNDQASTTEKHIDGIMTTD
jgi:hypothetical protein